MVRFCMEIQVRFYNVHGWAQLSDPIGSSCPHLGLF